MRRGAKPSKARVESKLPVAPKSRKNEGSRVRDLTFTIPVRRGE